jgi:hypothetical protein
VSTLVAGVRSAAGHPSEPKIAADTGVAIDTSLATSAGHQPSGGQWFRKQRTVNPPIVPARYNFLQAGPVGGLRPGSHKTATGAPAPPSRQVHDAVGHPPVIPAPTYLPDSRDQETKRPTREGGNE